MLIAELVKVDLSKTGTSKFGSTEVEVIDSVKDYVLLLEEIFDFPLMKSFLQTTPDFRVLFDGMHGVTGPYARAILVETLGLPEAALQNCVPLPDFGGGHPDPNPQLTRTTWSRPSRLRISHLAQLVTVMAIGT